MKGVIARIVTLRTDAHDIGEGLTSRFGSGDDRSACFRMIFNHATIAAEMLDAYRVLWDVASRKHAAKSSDAEIKETRHQKPEVYLT